MSGPTELPEESVHMSQTFFCQLNLFVSPLLLFCPNRFLALFAESSNNRSVIRVALQSA